MKAVVKEPLCALRAEPDRDAGHVDEVLAGWLVEVVESPWGGWVKVRTGYRYEGYLPWSALGPAEIWAELPKRVVGQAVADVLCRPAVESLPVATLPRGALVVPVGEAEGGWQCVEVADGQKGYTKSIFLSEYYENPPCLPPESLRERIVESALGYLSVQYRWGGRTPLGVDCSGLTSMAYLLNGIAIFRDARIAEGFPIHAIPLSQVRPADLLYFPGHVALALGEGRYLHASASAGRVVINSLDPASPEFRGDLAGALLGAGSWF